MNQRFVPDARFASAPQLPEDRPPTRNEVWERNNYLFHDFKPRAELIAFCKAEWAYLYVTYRNKGWDKQPDWKEGDPTVPNRIPPAPIESGRGDHFYYRLLQPFLPDSERQAA